MVVYGSGGHTAEMLVMISRLSETLYRKFYFILAESDRTSQGSIHCAGLPFTHTAEWYTIKRSREVHQHWFSSIFSVTYSLAQSFFLVARLRPDVLLVNGPGTCVPICLSAFLLKILGVWHTHIIYTESFCRVKDLSLSGKILYHISDNFVVQWPELCQKYRRAEYIGQIC
jgi:beta-1,4-N-acetylglucosaminyltransferase